LFGFSTTRFCFALEVVRKEKKCRRRDGAIKAAAQAQE